ncbi:MAG: methyl-accepting chemotaxis protein [Halobacteriaceae archaeon]
MGGHADASGSATSAGGSTSRIADYLRYVPSGDSIPDSTWRGRHRAILALIAVHVPLLVLLGLYHGTESVTGAQIPAFSTSRVLLGVGVVVAFGALAAIPQFTRRTRTGLATIGLASASAVLVYFSGGYIEAHFHFFVVMAVVAVYEDWLPFLLGIVYVALQHGYFGMTSPELVYNHAAAINNPWAWAVIHATFVLALAVALTTHWYSTERSREEARETLQEAEAKSRQVEDLEAKKAEVEAAREEARERQAEVERLNDHLEAKADAYSEAMRRAAAGDLGVRLDPESESEAMTRIAESCNEMLSETEAAVAEVQTIAHDVSETSEDASDGARAVERASEEVSGSIQGIADGATEQREMLDQVTTEMSDLSATIEEVAASTESVADRSREMADVADSGEATATDAIERTRAVQGAIDSTVADVEALDERMAEIGDIVDLIGDVAEQTNILALNANIEAARVGTGAGDGDGEGFAVVANEVKQLAEETRTSTSDIEQLIDEVQSQTRSTVDEVQAAQRDVEAAVEAVEEVLDAFATVTEHAAATDTGVQEIRDATDDQAASAEEAVAVVEDVADISASTADDVAGVSAAAQEQAASASQVADDVGSLRERADRLRSLLSTFDVDAAAAETVDGPAPGTALGDGGRTD